MKILFVSHDANRAGAQLFLLNIMKYLQQKGFSMHLLLLSGGILEKEFEKICGISRYSNTDLVERKTIYKKTIAKLIGKPLKQQQNNDFLVNENFDIIYANTIATASILPNLFGLLKIPLYIHIHELEFSIQLYSTKTDRVFLFDNATKIIACSNAVAENIIEKHNYPVEKTVIIHSFVDNENVLLRTQNADNQAIKETYNLPQDAFLVGGCGNAEWRKGIDVFVNVVERIVNNGNENFHFVWIGVKKDGEYYGQICYDIEKMGLSKYITFIEPTPDAIELINCLDIFTVVSREDPFPLVMLEAALSQKAIIGFKNTGGCSEFIEDNAGVLVDYLDTSEMANKILELYKNPQIIKKLGENAKNKVLEKYSFENSVIKIEKLLTSPSLG